MFDFSPVYCDISRTPPPPNVTILCLHLCLCCKKTKTDCTCPSEVCPHSNSPSASDDVILRHKSLNTSPVWHVPAREVGDGNPELSDPRDDQDKAKQYEALYAINTEQLRKKKKGF